MGDAHSPTVFRGNAPTDCVVWWVLAIGRGVAPETQGARLVIGRGFATKTSRAEGPADCLAQGKAERVQRAQTQPWDTYEEVIHFLAGTIALVWLASPTRAMTRPLVVAWLRWDAGWL